MENGAFAPKEQMLHFPQYFQICDIQRRQNALLWIKGLIWMMIIVVLLKLDTSFYENIVDPDQMASVVVF